MHYGIKGDTREFILSDSQLFLICNPLSKILIWYISLVKFIYSFWHSWINNLVFGIMMDNHKIYENQGAQAFNVS